MSPDNEEIIRNARKARELELITAEQEQDAIKLAIQNEAEQAILEEE